MLLKDTPSGMIKGNINAGLDKVCYNNLTLHFDGKKMKSDNQDNFKTSDTALAAFLITEGYNTPDIEYNGTRASFIFSRKNPKISNSISDWDTARAETNAVLFFNAYQSLLRRIKERY